MKIYKINDNPKGTFLGYGKLSGDKIVSINNISELEFNLLVEDIELDVNEYKLNDFMYVKFENGIETYVLKSDIVEINYLTEEESKNKTFEFIDFLTKYTYRVDNNWRITNFYLPKQTTAEMYRIFEATKSSISLIQFGDKLNELPLFVTVGVLNSDYKERVMEFINQNPDLLKYKDIEWYYEYLKL